MLSAAGIFEIINLGPVQYGVAEIKGRRGTHSMKI